MVQKFGQSVDSENVHCLQRFYRSQVVRGFLPSTLAPQKFKLEEKRFLLACGKLVNLQGRTANIPGSIAYDSRVDGSS